MVFHYTLIRISFTTHENSWFFSISGKVVVTLQSFEPYSGQLSLMYIISLLSVQMSSSNQAILSQYTYTIFVIIYIGGFDIWKITKIPRYEFRFPDISRAMCIVWRCFNRSKRKWRSLADQITIKFLRPRSPWQNNYRDLLEHNIGIHVRWQVSASS